MTTKKLLICLMLAAALTLAIGLTVASAGGDERTISYCAGCINGCDCARPVAVYYDYDTVEKYDDDGNLIQWRETTAVTLWGIDKDSNGHLELYVTVDDLVNAAALNGGWAEFEHNGFVLGYSDTGWLWAKAPGGYEYMWQAKL
jgi:hypothetical protein